MTITQIKAALGISTLMMIRQKDQESGAVTPWISHWDNDLRIRVTMHEDVFNEIKKSPEKADLAFKKQLVAPKLAADGKTIDREGYLRIVVIIPANVEATF